MAKLVCVYFHCSTVERGDIQEIDMCASHGRRGKNLVADHFNPYCSKCGLAKQKASTDFSSQQYLSGEAATGNM